MTLPEIMPVFCAHLCEIACAAADETRKRKIGPRMGSRHTQGFAVDFVPLDASEERVGAALEHVAELLGRYVGPRIALGRLVWANVITGDGQIEIRGAWYSMEPHRKYHRFSGAFCE